jgi:hypothetical protein
VHRTLQYVDGVIYSDERTSLACGREHLRGACSTPEVIWVTLDLAFYLLLICSREECSMAIDT